MTKRILALITALCLVFGMMPAVFAAEVEETPEVPEETVAPPAETEPVETEPVETEPIETEPTETQPSDPSEPVSGKPSKPDRAPDESGTWGDNLTWELYDTTLFISGEGEMAEEGNGVFFPWQHLTMTLTCLVIEEGVTSVSSDAFLWFRYIESIWLPETMTSLGYRCFELCESLKEIYLPESITEMDSGVFDDCSSLTKINIPKNMTYIPDRFVNGSAISEIDIPDSVTMIGSEAFKGCVNLTHVDLPDGLTVLCAGAFEACTGITSIEIPSGITILNTDTFSETGLTEVIIPDTVTELGQRVFKNCTALKSVVLPDHLTSLGDETFAGCTSLTEIDLPDSLERISWDGFSESGLTHIELPNSVTEIGARAFQDCKALESVVLSENLTRIRDTAFSGCEKLASIELPSSLEKIETSAFSGTSLVSVVIPDSVNDLGYYVFEDCPNLEAVLIPDSVTTIGEDAFLNSPNAVVYCYNLSYAHLYALSYGYPVELLEDEPGTPVYDIILNCGSGGSAIAEPDPSPANRYVLVEVQPDPGYMLESIYYQCANDPYQEVIFEQVSDTVIAFFMPASDIYLDVYFVSQESPFKDVKESDYFYAPVLWAVSRGITTGMGNGQFAPNSSCTRAQVVTFLWRAAGEPEPMSGSNPFTDVKETDYFYKAVLWAVENGITTGMSATSFGPSRPCTRGQVVTFLYRAAGGSGPYYGYNPFTDVKESDYYYDAVLWAVDYGITTGMSADKFGPNSTCTRGQVVTFLFRFLY